MEVVGSAVRSMYTLLTFDRVWGVVVKEAVMAMAVMGVADEQRVRRMHVVEVVMELLFRLLTQGRVVENVRRTLTVGLSHFVNLSSPSRT